MLVKQRSSKRRQYVGGAQYQTTGHTHTAAESKSERIECWQRSWHGSVERLGRLFKLSGARGASLGAHWVPEPSRARHLFVKERAESKRQCGHLIRRLWWTIGLSSQAAALHKQFKLEHDAKSEHFKLKSKRVFWHWHNGSTHGTNLYATV